MYKTKKKKNLKKKNEKFELKADESSKTFAPFFELFWNQIRMKFESLTINFSFAESPIPPLQVVAMEADQVARLEQRRQAEADGSHTWRKHQQRIHQLKAQQATLKAELAAAKLALRIPPDRWSYERKSPDPQAPSSFSILLPPEPDYISRSTLPRRTLRHFNGVH